jgi:hypothetical protein
MRQNFKSQPSPWGEGGPLPALSPAGAGRVRGLCGSRLRKSESVGNLGHVEQLVATTPEPLVPGFAGPSPRAAPWERAVTHTFWRPENYNEPSTTASAVQEPTVRKTLTVAITP